MIDELQPRRWLDDTQDSPPEFASAARAHEQLCLSSTEHAQAYERLAARAGLSTVTEHASVRGFGRSWQLVAGAALIGLGWFCFGARHEPRPRSVERAASRGAPLPPTAAMPSVRTTSDSEPALRAATVIDRSDSAHAGARSRSHAVKAVEKVPRGSAQQASDAARATTASTVYAGQSDLRSELQLLSRARRVLSAAPARALQLTVDHAAQYPQGMFGEEREVIAIDALVQLGRRAEARVRAERFSQNYPDSAHQQRVADILAAR